MIVIVLFCLIGYVQCFGTCECFALAFGVPAVLMIISISKLLQVHTTQLQLILFCSYFCSWHSILYQKEA